MTTLTKEQELEIFERIQAEKAAEKLAKKEDRQMYKRVVNEVIPEVFEALQKASEQLLNAKRMAFDSLQILIELKSEAYGRSDDQLTHSFTSEEGKTITLGCHTNDGWDDTVTAGISRVGKYIDSLAKDEATRKLVGFIRRLLQKDAKGNLDSKKVMLLKMEADKIGDVELQEAVQIIMDSYAPVRSREFVRCFYRGENGANVEVPLNITAASRLENKEVQNAD